MALSARLALKGSRRAGQPLPKVPELAELYSLIGDILSGQLIMVAGRPGSLKSSFALWLVQQWNLPTLYVSADMSQHTVSTRLGAMITGMPTRQVSEIVGSEREEDQYEAEWIASELAKSKLAFYCNPEPTLDDIDAELNAWVELRDEFPSVVVIDNLMDMAPLAEKAFESDKSTLKELQVMARETGSTIIVLHHMKEEGDASKPLPAKGVQGKVTQSVELALSVALDSEAQGELLPFLVSPVKTREGKGFPNANRWIELSADPSRNRFKRRDAYLERITQQ